jgi:methyl coenzyme M reductase gamma subunit
MDGATQEIVQGVTLEAISTRDLPDTEALLVELGAMYPMVSYPAAEPPLEEWDESADRAGALDRRREQLDASIMAGLIQP